MSEIVLGYEPRRQFVPFHMRTQRFACMPAHRRAGKTVACVMDILDHGLRCPMPHGRYAYIGPYLAQAKEIAWDYLKRFAEPVTEKKDEGEVWVQLKNGARIRIHGADNPDRLRGAYLDGVVLDEYADMKPGVWETIIRPMLTDRRGWAVFIGTFKGKNHFHKLSLKAQTDRAEWFYSLLRASETGIVPYDELEKARIDMGDDLYAQEFELNPEMPVLGAVYRKELDKARREGRIGPNYGAIAGKTVDVAFDLGKSDMCFMWFMQQVGTSHIAVDCYGTVGEGIEHFLNIIQGRGYVIRRIYLPHDAAQQHQAAKKTIERQVRDAYPGEGKVKVLPPTRTATGHNAVRRLFSRLYFNEDACADGLTALHHYRYAVDPHTKERSKEPVHDAASHPADALETYAMGLRKDNELPDEDKTVWVPPSAAPEHGHGWMSR